MPEDDMSAWSLSGCVRVYRAKDVVGICPDG